MMYEGEDTNTIDLLYEQETAEGNGVKIIIPLKSGDYYTFCKKIKEQLCYFEDVYFDVPNDTSITNGFVIARHNDFQFSELCSDSNMHVCLDNVYYPLDFSKIGIDSIRLPIGLIFSLTDGIFPTPNRESLRYTKEAKEIILAKLSSVADYFVDKYNQGIDSGSDLASMITHLEGSGKMVSFNNSTLNINSLTKFAKIPVKVPTLDGISLINFPSFYGSNKRYLLQSVAVKFYLNNKRMSDGSKGYYWNWTLNDVMQDNVKVYMYDDKVPGIKKDYLRSLNTYQEKVFLVKPSKPMVLGHPAKFDMETYYHLLNLKNYPKSQWRDVIKEYQLIISMIHDKFINLDSLVIPQTFIDSRKKIKSYISTAGTLTARKPKLKGEVIGKRAESLMKWSEGRNGKFVPVTYKLEDLHKSKHLKVYTHHDDYLKLDALFGLIDKQKIELVTFSQRELNLLKDVEIHNLISLEKFMEGTTAPFKRMATAYYIKKLQGEYHYAFERSQQVGFTSVDLRDKLDALKKYAHDNYATPGYSGGGTQSKEFLESMLKVAEDNKLFDMNIYPEAVEMREILSKLPFLNTLCQQVGYYDKLHPIVSVMTDLFKYYKHRVNLDHYNLRLTEDVLTEEQVEELID